MENFAHIIQRMSIETGTSSSSGQFGGTSPFKVQVNFYIPIFEGQIYADALDKWLNLLECYFFVYENIYVYFIITSLISFLFENNMNEGYQRRLFLIIFQCMAIKRFKYRMFVSSLYLLRTISLVAKKPSMVKEKKNDRA